MNRELLQEALELIDDYLYEAGDTVTVGKCESVMNKLKAELAKPDPEPIAWVYKDEFKDIENGVSCMALLIGKHYYYQSGNLIPLYLKDE